eukprot:TRINITY_DN27498_c0_g1_i1.p1 TRINITY_DN27498_c0_g1~~TRINITY_DN27498_c0_g1_i1.p1  ORF type:complete len:368 (+),score=46.35 TRINITY_DN27498_c0_g1_i1:30-1106(+)
MKVQRSKLPSRKPGTMKKQISTSKTDKKARVVCYIHASDGGKEDLEKYMAGQTNLILQVYQEERLPDLDESSVINGLDQVGTCTDFSDELHQCTRACPVGCQGHLRPNEISIYEGLSEKGKLVERKRYKARFICRESAHPRNLKIKKTTSEVMFEVGEEVPEKYRQIIDNSELAAQPQVQREYGWNPSDRSFNLTMKSSEDVCVRRQPVTQSTDGVRAKIGISRGVSVYEITWPVIMRGTHASVGVATRHAPLHSPGYIPLIGNNLHSWGWDIGRKIGIHNAVSHKYPSTVENHYQWTVPESFFLIIDMDEGEISFAGGGRWFGVAFDGLQGETVFPAVSTVWGHAEVSIRYIGSSRR